VEGRFEWRRFCNLQATSSICFNKCVFHASHESLAPDPRGMRGEPFAIGWAPKESKGVSRSWNHKEADSQ
jgi:hypothetical protein